MNKRIYIRREGHEFGPLSLADAQTQLQQGAWTGDTPARFEDSPAWVTLKELLETTLSTATEPFDLPPLSSERKPVHLPPLPPPPQPPGPIRVRSATSSVPILPPVPPSGQRTQGGSSTETEGIPEDRKTLPEPPRRRRRGWRWALLFVLLGLYAGYPYYCIWQLKRSLTSGGESEIQVYIDFETISRALREQAKAKIQFTNSKEASADPNATRLIMDPTLDDWLEKRLTPAGLLELRRQTSQPAPVDIKPVGQGVIRMVSQRDGLAYDLRLRSQPVFRVGYCFFRAPSEFEVCLRDLRLDLLYVNNAEPDMLPLELTSSNNFLRLGFNLENYKWRLKNATMDSTVTFVVYSPKPVSIQELRGLWRFDEPKDLFLEMGDTDSQIGDGKLWQEPEAAGEIARIRDTSPGPQAIALRWNQPNGAGEAVILRQRDNAIVFKRTAGSTVLPEFSRLTKTNIVLNAKELIGAWKIGKYLFILEEDSPSKITGSWEKPDPITPTGGSISRITVKGRRAEFDWSGDSDATRGSIVKTVDGSLLFCLHRRFVSDSSSPAWHPLTKGGPLESFKPADLAGKWQFTALCFVDFQEEGGALTGFLINRKATNSRFAINRVEFSGRKASFRWQAGNQRHSCVITKNLDGSLRANLDSGPTFLLERYVPAPAASTP